MAQPWSWPYMTPIGSWCSLLATQSKRSPGKGASPLKDLREGDYQLTGEIVVGNDTIGLVPQTVSIAKGVSDRLKQVEAGLKGLGDKPKDTQRATIADHLALLKSLWAKESPETNYPAAHLLAETEDALKAESAGTAYFGGAKPGEFWLTLADSKSSVPVRLMAPHAVAKGKPLPLVIAFHGAGGSENMFFDAYGNGKIVRLCRQRGWLLVAPRLSFLGLGMPVDHMIAEISNLYAVDRQRILVVGHSMVLPRRSAQCKRRVSPWQPWPL